jgi:Multicopper oxidase
VHSPRFSKAFAAFTSRQDVHGTLEPHDTAAGNALTIPPLLSPPVGPDGMRTFDLTLERGPTEQGRKDGVMVRPRETVPLLMRFTDYTDPQMPYRYHCHILQHEDQGMMGQFVVVPA